MIPQADQTPEAVAESLGSKTSREVLRQIIAEQAEATAYWTPQEGPQLVATEATEDLVFFGGTRGGGKSDCLLGKQLIGARKWGKHWNGLILRKRFKDFSEMRRRIDELILEGLPAVRVGGEQQTNYIRFYSGAIFSLTAILHLQMVDTFHGHQYTLIGIDEAPDFPFIAQMIEKLKGSLRSPHGVPSQMFLTGNPGGTGSIAVKVLFMNDKEPNKIYTDNAGETSIFIPSALADNKILMEKDPKYIRRLQSIKNKALREAWLNGNWDVFIGQAFDFDAKRHIVPPIWPIPDYAPLYMTFDWGFGKPFSVGWWWVDSDNRVYRFSEWYGWDEAAPDVGLRLVDSDIAQGIIDRELGFDIKGREVRRLAGPDCFSKKPDYRGGGQGPSTSDVFQEAGLLLTPGDPSRVSKIKQFRERLSIPDDSNEMPMLVIYEACKNFTRTIPSLCVDEMKPEDIDTQQEDHIYDEACHMLMCRPLSLEIPEPIPKTQAERDWAQVLGINTSQAHNMEM